MKLEFRLEQFGKVISGLVWDEHLAQAWPPQGMPIPPVPVPEPTNLAEFVRRNLPIPEGPDIALNIFRRDLALALMASPSTYMRDIDSYRESEEFQGGSVSSLVALIGATPGIITVEGAQEKRTRDVAKMMQGVHVEKVRAPWDYANDAARVWGIVRDVPAPGSKEEELWCNQWSCPANPSPGPTGPTPYPTPAPAPGPTPNQPPVPK